MGEVRGHQRQVLRRQVLSFVEQVSPLAAPLLDRVVAAAQADARFVGVTLGGSGASGSLDRWSDLDLVLVCADGAEAAVLAGLPAFAAGVGPLLASFTGEHVGEPRLLISLYGPPLLHVDMKVIALADVAQRVEDGRVLWERGGAVTGAMSATTARWPDPGAQWIEDRFWVWLHYGAAKLGRGELFECLDMLAAMRAMVLGPLLARRHGVRAQGVRRVERWAPEAVPQLVSTIGDGTAAGCVAALRATARLYRELRDDDAAPPVERRGAAETEALRYLDEVAAGAVTP